MPRDKEYAFEWIENSKERIVEISDKIWEFAELGLMEFKSSSLLADELEKNGFKVIRGVAQTPTAFLAWENSLLQVFLFISERIF